MKKHLLTLALLGSFGWAAAQSLEDTGDQLFNDKVLSRSVSTSKTVSCDIDSIFYGFNKATGLSTIGINTATSANAASQYFDCPQPITVSGGSFFAWKANETGGISINVTLALYTAGPDSLPTGAPLAMATVAVDTTFGGGSLGVLEKGGNFPPVVVTQPYCMVVSNNSANSITMAMSSYTAGDGQGEWLGSARIGTNWLHGYELAIGGLPFDADALIQPLVSYEIDADFDLVGLSCVPADGTAMWQNNSSPVLFNRMYSVAEFLGIPDVSFSWDYGDGTALDNVVDGAHTYTGAPAWNVTLTDSLFGWVSTCVDVETQSTADQVDGAFSSSTNGMQVDFTDLTAGPNIVAWSWDFGDGSTSTMQNPSYTYAAPGMYTVCLTSSSDCNSDVVCQPVNITVTGIEDVSLSTALSVYPNPSNGNFTLELEGVESDVTVTVTDMAGKTLHASNMPVAGSIRKEFDLNLASGTYLLQLTAGDDSVVRMIEVK